MTPDMYGQLAKMRVLHVYRTYYPDPPGGLQEAIRQIALSTRLHDVEARIFTLSPSPVPTTLDRTEGQVIRARSWVAPASCDLGLFGSWKQFKTAAKWADVIHYHFPWPFADLLHFSAQIKKPGIMTYHSDIIQKRGLLDLYRPVMKRMLANMDAVIATSQAYLDTSSTISTYVPEQRRHVIPLGILEESCTNSIQAARHIDIEQQFGVKTGDYFLFIGALRPYKGLDVLLKAARETQYPLIIAGIGREEARIRETVSSMKHVKMVGKINDAEKFALLQSCRALVLPSNWRSEAFGVVLIEASMCAKPMICCEIGTGTSFVNMDKETGLVIEPDNTNALSTAMTTLMDRPELAEQFGNNARKRYEDLFSGEAQGKAYARLYQQVVNARKLSTTTSTQ